MINLELTESQRIELESQRSKRNSNIGERAWFVLLSSKGKTPLAEQIGHQTKVEIHLPQGYNLIDICRHITI